jgi:hypothetical protein
MTDVTAQIASGELSARVLSETITWKQYIAVRTAAKGDRASGTYWELLNLIFVIDSW